MSVHTQYTQGDSDVLGCVVDTQTQAVMPMDTYNLDVSSSSWYFNMLDASGLQAQIPVSG